jgi:hypothetical protein
MRMPPELANIIAAAQAARSPARWYPDPGDVTDGNTMNLYGPSLRPPGTSMHLEPSFHDYNLFGPLARAMPPWLRKRFDRSIPTFDLVEKPGVRVPMWNEPNYSIPAPTSKWYA